MIRSSHRHAGWLTAGFLLFATALDSAAADRALLIGVGQYANPSFNLNGIDIDLERMDAQAERLGFTERKRLADAEATAANAESQIEEWLVKGTGPGDRALIYFSGHGSRIPDENGDETEDQADEVLVMHDAREEGGKLTGVLVDDRLRALLERIPAKETLVLVDACHSGSATKSIRLRNRSSGLAEGQSKFLPYAGMPEAGGKEVALAEKADETAARFAGLSAAADNEFALASKRGSLFTRALAEILDEGAKAATLKARGLSRQKETGAASDAPADGELTLQQVHARATALIAKYVAEDADLQGQKAHHPALNGNPALARKPLRVRVAAQGNGTAWERVRQLAQSAGGRLQAKALASKLEEGDLLQLEIEVPDKKGYLNVLQVDALDQVQVLFPNKMDQNNEVTAGTLQLPGQRPFDLVIREPFGRTLIVAFFSRRPMNLYEASNGKRDLAGKLVEVFPSIDAASTRSAVADPSLYAAALEVSTCAEKRACP